MGGTICSVSVEWLLDFLAFTDTLVAGLQRAATAYDLRTHYKLQRRFWARFSARFAVCFQFDRLSGVPNDASG